MITRKKCPVCGSDDTVEKIRISCDDEVLREALFSFKYHLDITGAFYTIRKCIYCGLYFQETVLDDAEASMIYSSSASAALEKHRSIEEVSHFAEDAILIRLLYPNKKPAVLDFGMNTGDWAHVVSAYGCDTYGTDIAQCSESCAKNKGIKFVKFDDLPDNFFDFINADQVFEHLACPLEALRRLSKALNHNGIIKISCPGDEKIEKKLTLLANGKVGSTDFCKQFKSLSPFIHINLFDAKSLIKLGENAGLKRIRIPIRISYSTMTLFNSFRQINRNLWRPIKQFLSNGTWQYFIKK